MPELITESLEDCEKLILKLVREPAVLSDLRGKLAENSKTKPLFNTENSVRNIERAYLEIWRRYLSGSEAQSIDLF